MVGRSTDELHPEAFAREINERDALVVASRASNVIDSDPIHYPAICATKVEHSTYLPVFEHGEVVGISCYTVDKTDLRNREAELQAKERQWALLTEDADQGVMIHNFSVPLFVNRRLVDMFGYKDAADFLQHRDWQIIFAPEESSNTPIYRQKVTQQTIPFVRRIFRGLKKNGERLWCEATLRFPIIWEGQQCLQATIADVTARVDAQESYATLTKREQDVVSRLYRGMANKEIALDLGISHRTVEVYRARAVSKLGVENSAELISLVGRALEHQSR